MRLPLNEDLELTFPEEGSFKPTFTKYLDDGDEDTGPSGGTMHQTPGTAYLTWHSATSAQLLAAHMS